MVIPVSAAPWLCAIVSRYVQENGDVEYPTTEYRTLTAPPLIPELLADNEHSLPKPRYT